MSQQSRLAIFGAVASVTALFYWEERRHDVRGDTNEKE